MFAIIHLLATFIADLFKSPRRLEVENLFLRHQLNNDHSCRITRRRSTSAFAFFLPDFRDGATKRSNDKIERRIFTCAPKSTERNYPRVGFAVLQATLQGLRPWTARSRFAEIEAGHEPLHWDAIRLLTASIPASSNSRSR
jgi:hypothetical protein